MRRAGKQVFLGQYRTILRAESRRPVFWQVKQKCSRILCVFASIFVTVAGKSASEATLQASAVNCAALGALAQETIAPEPEIFAHSFVKSP